jgi:hypothetical protein
VSETPQTELPTTLELFSITVPKGTPIQKEATLFHLLPLQEITRPSDDVLLAFEHSKNSEKEKNKRESISSVPPVLIPPPLFFGQIPHHHGLQKVTERKALANQELHTTVISAAPQLRDLQKELTHMVPVALRKKEKEEIKGGELKEMQREDHKMDQAYEQFMRQLQEPE